MLVLFLFLWPMRDLPTFLVLAVHGFALVRIWQCTSSALLGPGCPYAWAPTVLPNEQGPRRDVLEPRFWSSVTGVPVGDTQR